MTQTDVLFSFPALALAIFCPLADFADDILLLHEVGSMPAGAEDLVFQHHPVEGKNRLYPFNPPAHCGLSFTVTRGTLATSTTLPYNEGEIMVSPAWVIYEH